MCRGWLVVCKCVWVLVTSVTILHDLLDIYMQACFCFISMIKTKNGLGCPRRRDRDLAGASCFHVLPFFGRWLMCFCRRFGCVVGALNATGTLACCSCASYCFEPPLMLFGLGSCLGGPPELHSGYVPPVLEYCGACTVCRRACFRGEGAIIVFTSVCMQYLS